jgi:hypothetical protein
MRRDHQLLFLPRMCFAHDSFLSLLSFPLLSYHSKVANEMAEDAPDDTLAYIIKNCPSMSEQLRRENLAFFLEALTPAFASFWTICNVAMMTQTDEREKAKTDPVYRQQCIKESLRM